MMQLDKTNFSMLDYIPVGLCLIDSSYTIIYWNRCLEELTGLAGTKVMGTDVRDHFLQIKEAHYQSRLESIFKGESLTIFSSNQHEHNFTLQMPTGDLRLQHVNITAVPSSDRNAYFALFAIEDVTELNKTIQDYRTIRDEVLEELKHRRIMEEELIAYREHLERMVKDRTKELSEANKHLQKEIAEKTKVEQELQQALDQNEKLLSSISSILIGVNAKNIISHWNATAEEIFNIKAENVIGEPFNKCNIKWNWDEIKRCVRLCRHDHKPHKLNEVRYIRSNGKECFLNITVNPFIDNCKTRSGFLILAEDITERKILEAHLAQAQKLESIGQLAAGIAHEINTPIQYVGDNTRFLKDSFHEINRVLKACDFLGERGKKDTISDDRLNKLRKLFTNADIDFLLSEIPVAIEQTEDGVERVANIVRAMKDFSHPGAKEMTYLDINQAIMTTITVARNEWKYVADMQTDLYEDLPLIACFPDEFNQVILNLITNAAHAIAEKVGDGSNGKGEIKIRTNKIEQFVEIHIEDTGGGIPDHIKPRIFDPFFTTKEVGKGTGQGLAIAHNAIVERLGGSISFETEMGIGTTFLIRLPIENINVEQGVREDE